MNNKPERLRLIWWNDYAPSWAIVRSERGSDAIAETCGRYKSHWHGVDAIRYVSNRDNLPIEIEFPDSVRVVDRASVDGDYVYLIQDLHDSRFDVISSCEWCEYIKEEHAQSFFNAAVSRLCDKYDADQVNIQLEPVELGV